MRYERKLVLALALIGLSMMACPAASLGQVNADYSAVPPFLTSAVTPNVLILMDNSGSMGYRAACDDDTNQTSPTSLHARAGELFWRPRLTPACSIRSAVTPMTRRIPASSQAVPPRHLISTACASTLWDGNLLNWITFRRQDALKKALMGGQCTVARASDGTCPASGSTPLITIKTEDIFNSSCCDDVSTARVPTGGGSKRAPIGRRAHRRANAWGLTRPSGVSCPRIGDPRRLVLCGQPA